jgi:hypothetical protein
MNDTYRRWLDRLESDVGGRADHGNELLDFTEICEYRASRSGRFALQDRDPGINR